jgi:hypothetical protein
MDFFIVHDVYAPLILVGLAFFPRITMLFIGGPFSILHWLGWAFLPHFTVAFIATLTYWETNPFLVAMAWVCAVTGSSVEVRATARARKQD